MAEKIKIGNLTEQFDGGRIVAVDDLTLEIPSESFTSILGPSGCGKTTLLRCIAGLEYPDDGSIHFGSEEVTMQTPQERELSMVFQDVTLYPHLTCRENIEYPLKIQSVPQDERETRIEEAASLLHIADQLDKYPENLSGGQQQRVGLAAAIVNHTDIILLDEPMSDLDAKLKAELRVELQQLHQELDTTMVYVTHDQTEAMTMSDYVVVMRDGTVEQRGTPTEVFDNPTSKYVAEFIGQPEINIVPAATIPDFEIEDVAEVGIRPGELIIDPVDADFEFEVEISVIEPLGGDYIIHTEFKEHEFTIITREQPQYSIGDTVTVGASRDALHLFSVTGDRIVDEPDVHAETENEIHEH
jgi:multiple sugar transport system ATP-binding protein